MDANNLPVHRYKFQIRILLFHLVILCLIATLFFALSDVSKLISSLFHSQVFLSGFVHSDPHPANVMVRKHPKKRGWPQVVLVDHGLYKEIDSDFRILYAHLYKSLLLADVPAIQASCEKLGITKMVRIYSLLP
jgi:aarF domain-containing kinase